ncbi:TIGR03619 family F420-dependent LLM class oxidoreductase [Streptomyces katsurahamanus]|uniref:TIGR03619 family F420-dependent LLM class oxidoreductase n=1 Tax=Streptomyces katsurahamanus TaxID=2577098 RepID=A0ABW9NQX4_9ACTN|nr:TIGR03619 family F420-dependent LLM class oxidoreductase [Streptomyces katsurahamanus]MQS35304.1 TIGR03619 family F420-dependent LLM class oxidoreductase [Streptomyces katsurahamanus]
MRIAATAFLTDETIAPVDLARELEDRGFAGLYLPEHTHIPVERTTPAPMGGDLPREYGRILDPFVALAQAAAVTTRLGLGTGITLLAQHDPIVLAKQIATLDHLSGGRFTLGLGYGWNKEEAADHGVEWTARRDIVRDHLAVMRALWAAEPTPYRGAYASVRASHAHPKPAGGAPRILLGGAAGHGLFERVAQDADGWIPIGGKGLTEWLPVLRAAEEKAGRDPGTLQAVPYAVLPTPGKLAHYADLGVEEVVLQLPPATAPEVLRTLDEYAQYL